MPDHAVSPAELLQLVTATAVFFLAPGLAWQAVFWPPGADLGRLERMAGVFFVSYAAVGATALVLTRLGILSGPSLAVAIAVLVLAGIAASLPRLAGSSIRRPARIGPYLIAFGAALAIGLLVVAPQIGMVFPAGYPIGTITWYYWTLARQILEAGAIPAVTAEWGGLYEFQGDYIVFSAFSAALAALGGRASEFAVMEALRLSSLIWAVVAALGAFRRFLPRGGALIATLLFFTAVQVFLKYTGYRPEAFNYALIFSALWFTDRLAEQPSARRAVPVVVTIVLLWLGHGVVLVLAGLLAGAIVLARWLQQRPSLRTMLGLASVPVVGFVSASLVDLLLQGNVLLFANAADPARIQGPFASDLTWQFRQWALGSDQLLTGDPAEAENLITQRVFAPWPVFDLVRANVARLLLLLLGVVGLPFLLWRWLGPAARRLHLASFFYLAGLIAAVYSFIVLYDTYVPQRVGFGRLAPFTIIAAVIWLAVGATAMVNAAADLALHLRRSGRLPDRLRARLSASAPSWRLLGWSLVVLVAVAIGARPSIAASRGILEASKLSADGHAALAWIAVNTPPDSIVLANGYTEGSIAAIARRNGLLDGRAPYNKEFEFLHRSVDLLRLARSFYAGEATLGQVADQGVDIVIAAPAPLELAHAHSFCTPQSLGDRPCARDLSEEPGLRELVRFGQVVVYELDASVVAQMSRRVSSISCPGCQPVSVRNASESPRISGASSGRTSDGSTSMGGLTPASAQILSRR